MTQAQGARAAGSDRVFEALDAKTIIFDYQNGRTLRALATAHGVSKSTIHRLVRANGAMIHNPGQILRPRVEPEAIVPVIEYGDRFAYAGRCGSCLGRHDEGAECSPVKVSALTS